MVKLESLTIPYIKKLASECNINLKKGKKADLIKQIMESEVSKQKLAILVEKYLKQKNKAKIIRKKNQLDIPELEKRITRLEKQVKKLTSLHSEFNRDDFKHEKSVSKREIVPKKVIEKTYSDNLEDVKDVEKFISIILQPGNSLTIDNLVRIQALQNTSFSILKEAINNLISQGILEPIKGNSIQKIDGTIGKLLRK